MKDNQIFVDTNILVYAHDKSAGKKGDLARQCITELWKKEAVPCISVQVLEEFFVNLIKKEVSHGVARSIIEDYLVWDVIDNDSYLMRSAFDEKLRWKISFWDALIIAAAKRGGARKILSEDFSHGQKYDDLEVINPFRG